MRGEAAVVRPNEEGGRGSRGVRSPRPDERRRDPTEPPQGRDSARRAADTPIAAIRVRSTSSCPGAIIVADRTLPTISKMTATSVIHTGK